MKKLKEIIQLLPERRRKQLPVMIFLMILGAGFEVLSLGIIFPLMKFATGKTEDMTTIATEFTSVFSTQPTYILIALFAIAYLLKGFFLSFIAWMFGRFLFKVKSEICSNLFGSYITAPYQFHLANNSAHLIRNLTNEINQLVVYALHPTLVIVSEAFVIACISAFLIFIEPVGTLIIILLLFILAFSFQKFVAKYLARLGQIRQNADGAIIQKAQECIGGIKDVIILQKKLFFIKEFRELNNISAQVSGKQFALAQIPRLYLETMGALCLSIFLFLELSKTGDVLSIIPTLTVFALAAFRLLPSANRILGAINSIRYAEVVVSTLRDQFEQNSLASNARAITATQHFTLSSKVELKDVSYTYPGADTQSLSKITLTINQGECVGIIGKSGSGKSTLIDLLLGLLEPTSGKILVDEICLKQKLDDWQSIIGYVQQDIFLIDGSLSDNIAFGSTADERNVTKLHDAVSSAQLDELVNALPEKLNTMVGERGVRLSGGQKQRIGIARALYNGSEFLVFDEATSALDNDTEKDVVSAIKRLNGEKTIIIVAHRLTTVQNCDKIIEMDSGKILSVKSNRHLG